VQLTVKPAKEHTENTMHGGLGCAALLEVHEAMRPPVLMTVVKSAVCRHRDQQVEVSRISAD